MVGFICKAFKDNIYLKYSTMYWHVTIMLGMPNGTEQLKHGKCNQVCNTVWNQNKSIQLNTVATEY